MSGEKMRVLIIDDEAAIRSVLRLNFESEGFRVEEAGTAEAGLKKVTSFHPNLVILDLGLPDRAGLEVVRSLREWTSIPILVLSVTDDAAKKVNLLDEGADDYITKPFSMPELMARVRASLRNKKTVEATPVFRSGAIEININDRIVKVSGREVKFTATEFALLKYLVRDHGKLVTQQRLLKEIWGPNASHHTHYLRIYIAQIRKKIESDPASPEHLLTETGVGYRLV